MLVYLNGEFLPDEEARVRVTDRGFVFGDGVYEVVRAVHGSFFEWEAHLQRLREGTAGLSIPIGAIPSAEALEVGEELLRENGLTDEHATIYIQITRGCAPRRHSFPTEDVTPTVFLSVSPFEVPVELQARGARAILHPDMRWTRCDLKTVNLLPNILAKQKAKEAGAFEAILIRQGVVTEGASTNVFGVSDGAVRTYAAGNCILAGVTRRVVFELASEARIPIEEKSIFWDDVFDLDELFLTGTTTDVQPVIELDGRRIGDGRPGPVTRRLQGMFRERLEETGARVAAR